MPVYTPDQYKEKLKEVSISYSSLLNKDSYGNIESDCDASLDDSEACNKLDTYKHNLRSVGDDFFYIKESIFKDLEELIEGVNVNDEKISNYNEENKDLNEKNISLRDKINGAKGMKGDIQKRYNQSYYGNIVIMLSIIGGFVFYSGTRKL
jgi:hypothetical protein|tara:strand:- start:1154 stop:1606 length:453 start_codon:yes stop_codon:yes gene_type:complete